jgi:hypothetical protein
MPISTTQHDARNSVQSTSTINWQFAGNYTNDGMAAVSGLTITNAGTLFGGRSGVYFGDAKISVFNPQTNTLEEQDAVYSGGAAVVKNSGLIIGGVDLDNPTVPTGAGIEFGASVDTARVVNHATGSIDGPIGIYTAADSTSIWNAGSISGEENGVQFGAGASGKLTNSGSISKVAVQSTGVTIVNTGTIGEGGTAISSSAALSVQNYGSLIGDVLTRGIVHNAGDIDGDVTLGGIGPATVRNSGYIEGNVTLTGGNDTFDGRGGSVEGQISGGAGKDTIYAGREDLISGGAGADTIFALSDNDRDTFVFSAVTESGTTAATRDTITGSFTGGGTNGDLIDLSLIDANGGEAGSPLFNFIGSAAFTANADGQVRVIASGEGYLVQVDNDTDATAEMTIFVNSMTNLVKGDFLL